MDQSDPKLKIDFIAQARAMLAFQEKVFLDAAVDERPEASEALSRLLFLLKRLAKAVSWQDLFVFFESCEAFLEYCRGQQGGITSLEREVFVELHEHLCSCFGALENDPETNFDHTPILKRFEEVRASVQARSKSLMFTIGSSEKESFDKERADIQKLARDLQVLHQGISAGELSDAALKHLASISGKLNELGRVINLQKVSDLYRELGKTPRSKSMRQSFQGGEHRVDRRALAALRPALEDVLEGAFFAAREDRLEVFFRCYQDKTVKLEVHFACSKIGEDSWQRLESRMERLGFQVICQEDEYAGTKITVDFPATLNAIDGQVAHIGDAAYALDLRYVKECISLENESDIARSGSCSYFNYQGLSLPLLDMRECLGLEEAAPKGRQVVILELKGEKVALLIDSVGRRQSLGLRPINGQMPKHRYFKSVCFLESSLPVFLLDCKRIIRDLKASELKTSKFLEVKIFGEYFAFEAKDVKEVVPYAKLTHIPPAAGQACSMMNFQGEPLLVLPLSRQIGSREESQEELKNIIVCQAQGELLALSCGQSVAVRRVPEEDIQENTYQRQAQQVKILDLDSLRPDAKAVKKVA